MTGLDREAGTLVPLRRGTGIVGRGPLATQLVQAPALLRALIVEGLGEQPLVVERTPVAAVVNALPVKRFRPAELVQLGNCLLYTSPSPRDGLLSRMPSSA